MSRVRSVTGPGIGVLEAGGTATVEYDVPPDAWYFYQGATDSMPYAVLLEVALQPCGWLSSYVGSALSADEDLYYRNLDGRGRVLREVSQHVGMLTTATTLKKTSSSGGMIIQEFDFVLSDAQGPIFEGWTQFGFFPKAALARQVGTGFNDEDRYWLERPSDKQIDLTIGTGPYFEGSLRLPEPALLMIDRITGYWEEEARHGIARVRTEKDVNLKEWFFKAHFFQDPVQPGSLGIEAMVQALQWYMIERQKGEGFAMPRFQSIATDTPLEWKYRGQVVPKNALIQVEIEILEDRGDTVVAEGFLWADGLRIYHAQKLAMRVIEG